MIVFFKTELIIFHAFQMQQQWTTNHKYITWCICSAWRNATLLACL